MEDDRREGDGLVAEQVLSPCTVSRPREDTLCEYDTLFLCEWFSKVGLEFGPAARRLDVGARVACRALGDMNPL